MSGGVLGVIPARYGSSRLPGKPLADVCGKPMVWWAWRQARMVGELSGVVVATDDGRVEAACRELGMDVVMTSPDHATGADRLREVAGRIAADFYVQVNGDEPLIGAEAIRAAVPGRPSPGGEYGTNAIARMSDPAEVVDPTNIKVVFDGGMNAAYMSRTPVPYPYRSLEFSYYKHLGVIGYSRGMLEFYGKSEPGPLERAEGIDTLRFIDYGKSLKFRIVPDCGSLSVDTPKDLEEVRRRISSSAAGLGGG